MEGRRLTSGDRAGRRRALLALLLGIALVVPLLVAVRRWAPPPPSVLFILVDALRADRLGAYGRDPSLTPFLDDLTKDAVVYERAYSPSSWTVSSVASLFVAQRPFEHRVLDFGDDISSGATTLAEVLVRRGFETAVLTATSVIARGGFERGFTTYRVVGRPGFVENPDATELTAAAFDWFDHRDAARPFFLYLHYMEPHTPYRRHDGITRPAPSEVAASDEPLSWRAAVGGGTKDPGKRAATWRFAPSEIARLNDLYDGEVAYLDRQLAVLFEGLRARGALDRTIVVLTADHGEEFGEHGLYAHGVSLFEPAIRVPLVVRFPGGGPGTRIARPVESAGIGPTLLGALGVAPPPSFHVGALPLRTGDAEPTRVVSQLGHIAGFAIRHHRAAVVEGDRKLLLAPEEGLASYDLATDAAEQRPKPLTGDDRERAAAADLVEPGVPERLPLDLSPEAQERLRALGYIGGPAEPAPEN